MLFLNNRFSLTKKWVRSRAILRRTRRNTVFAGGVFAWVFLRIDRVFLCISSKQKPQMRRALLRSYMRKPTMSFKIS